MSDPHRTVALGLAAGLLALAVPAQDEVPRFQYRPGAVFLVVERDLWRETDARLDFASTTVDSVERRYTTLAVREDGSASVLVEEKRAGPVQQESTVRGRPAGEAKSAAADDGAPATLRLWRAEFTPQRFRTEPAREEAPVFYLQEIPEILAHVIALPDDGRREWVIEQALTRLGFRAELRRDANTVSGTLRITVRDPRVRDGEALPFPEGHVDFWLDPDSGLPQGWRVELRYTRFPVNRPNLRVISAEVIVTAGLAPEELARLTADFAAAEKVRAGFWVGDFPTAVAEAERFAAERPGSRLLPVVQAELAAFRREVPHFGEKPPDVSVARAFGEPLRLEAMPGKVVLLDFWATWCKPCIAGMEHLITLQERHRAAGLQVIGLTREDARQSAADVEKFVAEGYAASHGGRKLNYPLGIVANEAFYETFAIRSIPKLILLDRNGKVYFEHTGSGDQARVSRIVESLLAK